MTIKERAEKYLKVRFPEYQKDASVMHVDVEVFEAGFKEAIALALAGVEREKQYHEFLEEKHAEMRHPILACKEIAGYLRALASEPPPGACL